MPPAAEEASEASCWRWREDRRDEMYDSRASSSVVATLCGKRGGRGLPGIRGGKGGRIAACDRAEQAAPGHARHSQCSLPHCRGMCGLQGGSGAPTWRLDGCQRACRPLPGPPLPLRRQSPPGKSRAGWSCAARSTGWGGPRPTPCAAAQQQQGRRPCRRQAGMSPCHCCRRCRGQRGGQRRLWCRQPGPPHPRQAAASWRA